VEEEVCCGFGGVFSVKQPEISGLMLQQKLDAIEGSGAGVLCGGDVGCLIHMEGGLRRRESAIEVRHIAELLAGSE
jgi:L-lactate dehydrogenase complex protein LldE